MPTDDGAFVVGEPQGSPGWYPVNDKPRDKATFDFCDHRARRASRRWPTACWSRTRRRRQDDLGLARERPDGAVPLDCDARPLRPDHFDRRRHSVYVAVDPPLSKGHVLDKLPDMVDFYTSIYGPYPFNAVGAIVDGAKIVGYSLETQTKPVFDRMPNEATLVHELSHMWFGDSVTLTTGPTSGCTRASPRGRSGSGASTRATSRRRSGSTSSTTRRRRTSAFWTPPPGDSGHARLPVQRHDLLPRRDDPGGAAREDRRRRPSSGSCATGRSRTATATSRRRSSSRSPSRRAASNLDHFFDVWLYQPEKPTTW